MRMKISSMVREKVDSINGETMNGAKIVILGDFNSTPDDQEIKSLVAPSESGDSLVNLSERQAAKGIGTYRYTGIWEMIDQVIVSKKLLSCNTGLYAEMDQTIVFRPDFLLAKDPKYPGFTPFSTYRGYRYQGGFSDHLPILLNLKMRCEDQQD
jgi:exonuclease III